MKKMQMQAMMETRTERMMKAGNQLPEQGVERLRLSAVECLQQSQIETHLKK